MGSSLLLALALSAWPLPRDAGAAEYASPSNWPREPEWAAAWPLFSFTPADWAVNEEERVAGVAARYVALKRTPETINKRYQLYSEITPEDIRAAARKYFLDSGRTLVTLTSGGAK